MHALQLVYRVAEPAHRGRMRLRGRVSRPVQQGTQPGGRHRPPRTQGGPEPDRIARPVQRGGEQAAEHRPPPPRPTPLPSEPIAAIAPITPGEHGGPSHQRRHQQTPKKIKNKRPS
ncbi:acidic proline-rich protein PRP33-like [Phyllopteryx taeniolatus]|uniref:acidic proline-rich protein PRP33-like n=1 Tax=Phyllopteryx taeniolatus TaxID=161469 RepID=UPI002AD54498|nr:acidic proline-rich protein PRP33-like [Phyllopteryx taeniolatus]